MTENEKRLLDAAAEAKAQAYAPYSRYRVGAALLGEDGVIYTGVNVENACYGASICAERAAAVQAIGAGCRSFSAIAISAEGAPPVPCGICRQFLAEFSPEMEVIVDGAEPLRCRLADLLPHHFQLETEKP